MQCQTGVAIEPKRLYRKWLCSRTGHIAANLLLQGSGLGPELVQVHLTMSTGALCSSQAAHILASQG